MKYEGPVEIDAGGLLLDGPLGPSTRVAVIRRTAQADWSFPKGHLETGETLEGAALREVKEETGYSAECLGVAGAMAYEHGGRAKSVTYFFLQRRDDLPPLENLDGVESVEWLSFAEARERVSYEDLKALIDRVTGNASPKPPGRLSRGSFYYALRPRRDRLDAAIETYRRDVEARRKRPGTSGGIPSDEGAARPASATPWWRDSADDLLELASRYAAEGRIDAAWGALNGSQRLALHDLTPGEIELRARVLKAEASKKLSGWRKDAALAALETPAQGGVSDLVEAQALLDEHNANIYLKLRFAARRIALSAELLTLAVLLLWLATFLGAFDDVGVDGPFVLRDGGLFGGVVVLGMFGAMLSLALDNTNATVAQNRIFELATTRIAVPVARLAIGASAAVLTVAAAQAALTDGREPWVFLTAIPAGFSERLVRRSVEALEAKVSQA